MSLWQQTYKKFDVMVVDDASNPMVTMHELFLKLQERFEHEGHDFAVKRFDENNGIAKNRSLLLPLLKRYKLVFDLNDDHWLMPDVIQLLVDFMQAHPEAGGVGTATPFFFPTDDTWYEVYVEGMKINTVLAINGPKKDIAMTRKVDKIFLGKGGLPLKNPLEVDHISQFMYRPELIDELPTEYSVLGFSEETDLSLRVRKAGKKLYFLPHAVNWHYQSGVGGIRDHFGMKKVEMVKADNALFVKNWWEWLNDIQKD
jgi:GT2 family glycosyltransferase